MVQLYENGKSRASIVEEYDLTSSALDRWIHMRFRDTNIWLIFSSPRFHHQSRYVWTEFGKYIITVPNVCAHL